MNTNIKIFSDMDIKTLNSEIRRFQFSRNRCSKIKEIDNWRVCKILKRKEFVPNKETFTNLTREI